MTFWQWWSGACAKIDDGFAYEFGEFTSREAAIAAANRELEPGTPFYVIEARSSTSLKHEGEEIVPFLRTRNKERLVAGATAFEGVS